MAIVQQYVPTYRLAFFEGLVERLGDRGIDCFVVAGRPFGSQAARGDEAGGEPWLKLAEPKRLRVGHRTISFYGTSKHWRHCDAVIFELRGTSIDLNMDIAKKKITGRRLGVWGHVRPYTQPGHPLDLAAERHQMFHSDRVFAYTPSGADFAVAAGVHPSLVTCVMNSADVSRLVEGMRNLRTDEVRDFERSNNLLRGKVFGYLGGIDESKRIDFLTRTLDVLWERDREVKLVVGGSGDQASLLSPAAARGQVVMLGYAGPKEKALLAASCEGLINPGRIGLVAVECLAVGLPIFTTSWPFHAPEYEYLKQGKDVFVAEDSVDAFASLVLARRRPAAEATHRRYEAHQYPSLDEMIGNFADGVEVLVK
ncbi:glycosyltransferase [Mycobacterium sp. C31M]